MGREIFGEKHWGQVVNISRPLHHCDRELCTTSEDITPWETTEAKMDYGRVIRKITEKEDDQMIYRQRRIRARYADYCATRNNATRAVREAKYQYEKML